MAEENTSEPQFAKQISMQNKIHITSQTAFEDWIYTIFGSRGICFHSIVSGGRIHILCHRWDKCLTRWVGSMTPTLSHNPKRDSRFSVSSQMFFLHITLHGHGPKSSASQWNATLCSGLLTASSKCYCRLPDYPELWYTTCCRTLVSGMWATWPVLGATVVIGDSNGGGCSLQEDINIGSVVLPDNLKDTVETAVGDGPCLRSVQENKPHCCLSDISCVSRLELPSLNSLLFQWHKVMLI